MLRFLMKIQSSHKLTNFMVRLNMFLLTGAGFAFNNAYAFSVGDMVQNMNSEIQQLGRFIIIVCYLLAFGAGGNGIWKLIQANKQQGGQVTNKDAMIWLIVGGALAALPSIIGVATGSLFTGGQVSATNIQMPSFN